MSDFTPGPWKTKGFDPIYVLDSRGYDICKVLCLGAESEDRANARLIALAPRMYEFIQAEAEGGNRAAMEIVEEFEARGTDDQ